MCIRVNISYTLSYGIYITWMYTNVIQIGSNWLLQNSRIENDKTRSHTDILDLLVVTILKTQGTHTHTHTSYNYNVRHTRICFHVFFFFGSLENCKINKLQWLPAGFWLLNGTMCWNTVLFFADVRVCHDTRHKWSDSSLLLIIDIFLVILKSCLPTCCRLHWSNCLVLHIDLFNGISSICELEPLTMNAFILYIHISVKLI